MDWLLSDQVYNQVVKDHLGEVIDKPAWHTLLSFECQARKAALKLVNLKGMAIVVALLAIRTDTVLMQQHFITPTATAAGAEAARAAASGVAGYRSSSSFRRDIGPPARPAEGFEAPPAAAYGKGKAKESERRPAAGSPR